MRSHTRLLTFGLAIFSILSCQKIAYTSEAEKAAVQTELEAFVVNLSTIWPLDSAQISSNILDYLAVEGNKFYGCAVVELDTNGEATSCAYWYRAKRKKLDYANLMDPAYNINSQSWLTLPLAQGTALWSDPYFDAGGGEIWMQTYSVPIEKDGKIVGLATTDIRIKKP
jgi:hypothetical protein